VAEFVASKFQEFGLKHYRPKSGAGKEGYFLDARALVPKLKSAPMLQLLSANGSVIRNYERGRDFLETAAGHGWGGNVLGAYQGIKAAYDLTGTNDSIFCVRNSDYRPFDEWLFAQWGTKALLIEGDPSAAPKTDYSDEKGSQLLKGNTFLRYIVTPAVMDEILARGKLGAKLRLAWDAKFDYLYPRAVIGCIPGSEVGKDSELVISTALDTPVVQTGKPPTQDSTLSWFLALAEVMTNAHLHPKHTIVFAAFNGTHAGRLGSMAYLASEEPFRKQSKATFSENYEAMNGALTTYILEADKATSRFAMGRHVVNLVAGNGGITELRLGSDQPFFVMPGEQLAQDLSRLLDKSHIPLRTNFQTAGDDHTTFTKNQNPALTLALPTSMEHVERPGALADGLLKFVDIDAIETTPTPLEWLFIFLQALFVGACTLFIARWVLRFMEARKPHAPDPYNEFLKRSNQGLAEERGRPEN
jgi:hypothetical protein